VRSPFCISQTCEEPYLPTLLDIQVLRKERRRKEGKKEGRKEGRKEGVELPEIRNKQARRWLLPRPRRC
jgi:hypothetical protein